jgi:hypothetical protein
LRRMSTTAVLGRSIVATLIVASPGSGVAGEG